MIQKIGKQLFSFAPHSDGGGTAVSSRTPKRHHLDRRAQALAEILSEGDPDRLMKTIETSELLDCSVSFLEIGRIRGYGPPAIRLAPKMVRYRRRDVLEWVTERAAAHAAE